jgi:quercetin dioxygenase-like cupin family protein
MELQPVNPTAKAPAHRFTGDVYLTPIYIHAGETVICPPDEDHWHGAAADTFMSHLALLEAFPDGADPTTWLEPLPDDDYKTANQRH